MLITKNDLDTRICDHEPESRNTQTYREFIRQSEEEFEFRPRDLDSMSYSELNGYLDFLDDLWRK